MARAVEGPLTYNDRKALVQDAISDRLQAMAGVSWAYVYVCDMTDTWVVWCTDGDATWQADYSIDANGTVTLGTPTEVRPVTSYEMVGGDGDPAITVEEGTSVVAMDRMTGRVMESTTTPDGKRAFEVRIIAYGDSKNRRRYPEAVLAAAVPRYEGAKAYDHHRSDAELASGTVQGLVGTYRGVQASAEGLDATFHVLPSGAHVAEMLDASLANQAEGLDPLVGFSHDVIATFKPVTDSNGDRLMEATQIISVLSADVVADPAAGGQPTRAVAGGITPHPLKETAVPNEPTAGTPSAPTGAAAPAAAVPAAEAAPAPAAPVAVLDRATEAGDTFAKAGILGRLAIETQMADVADVKVRAGLVESVTSLLPDRFTEADLTAATKTVKDMAARFEVAGLAPTVPANEGVRKEAIDKKRARLDATFAGARDGYRSLKEAYADITGTRASFDTEEMARAILESSLGYHSDQSDGARRASESADTTTWGFILGDSITRRMVAEYSRPDMRIWEPLISSKPPILDFRTQRIDRLGGYGQLPDVAQGAPYQPLTTPGNEEVTYSISKKGGTEDLTLETIANDDMRLVVQIPVKLGRAAARRLFRDVLGLLITNPTCSYDSTALFAAGHSNTATTALSQSGLDAARLKMRKQQAYGDTTDDLSITPKYLWVPPDLESLAFQLCTSPGALGVGANTTAGANITNIPNIHQGLTPIVVDYWSGVSTTAWFLTADTADVPTVELGYFNGRQEPELFVQDAETVGSKFDRDAITWKIRFIYGLSILDHRGMQRGNT